MKKIMDIEQKMKKFLFFEKIASSDKKAFEKSQFLYIIMLYM